MNPLSDSALRTLRDTFALPEDEVGKYRIEGKLGAGGMATVFLAFDPELQRHVALKILDLPDASGELARRLRQEAQIIANLEHPGIVPVYDAGNVPDGRVYYAMKRVDGRRLDAYLRDDPPLVERLRVFEKVCETVAFAHARDVLHRDLKPENIMVGAFGEVLVMDWGLAKVRAGKNYNRPRRTAATAGEDRQTQHGTIMGTPAFMAPEQRRGEAAEIDQRTDIYALGKILELMLGEPEGDENTNRWWSRPAQRPSKYLVSICTKAMAEEPALRYPDARALAADIERFLGGMAVSAYQENAVEKIWRWIKRHRFLLFIVAVYILVRLLLILLMRP